MELNWFQKKQLLFILKTNQFTLFVAYLKKIEYFLNSYQT